MFVCCECCVLSGRGLCNGWSLVQRSPNDCGASLCVIKKPRMRRLKPATGLWKIQPKGCNAKKTNQKAAQLLIILYTSSTGNRAMRRLFETSR